jgi:hypothetical protein
MYLSRPERELQPWYTDPQLRKIEDREGRDKMLDRKREQRLWVIGRSVITAAGKLTPRSDVNRLRPLTDARTPRARRNVTRSHTSSRSSPARRRRPRARPRHSHQLGRQLMRRRRTSDCIASRLNASGHWRSSPSIGGGPARGPSRVRRPSASGARRRREVCGAAGGPPTARRTGHRRRATARAGSTLMICGGSSASASVDEATADDQG